MLLFIWDIFKPLQDEWIMKGHTHINEPWIYAFCYYLYGTLQDEWDMKGHTHRNEPWIMYYVATYMEKLEF